MPTLRGPCATAIGSTRAVRLNVLMERAHMQTRAMSAPLGLIVDDLDVRTINQADWRRLDELFCQHHVFCLLYTSDAADDT